MFVGRGHTSKLARLRPVLRCASYARNSTDKQNPLSTQDQLAKSREFAQSRGWKFLDPHVYTDQEASDGTLDRSGLRALLAAAESKPRAFDALLIEDASRLSRKQADVLNLCERLNFAGVKICFITQGIDSGDEANVRSYLVEQVKRFSKMSSTGRWRKTGNCGIRARRKCVPS